MVIARFPERVHGGIKRGELAEGSEVKKESGGSHEACLVDVYAVLGWHMAKGFFLAIGKGGEL